jgi:ATP-dependent helicase/nuclease subunit B
MSIGFTFGLAASGKTRWCLDRAAELATADPLGQPIFLVVPAQATLSTERLVVQRLGAVSRIQVVAPEKLIEQIAIAAGLGKAPDITDRARRMLVYRALLATRPQLSHFSKAAPTWSTATAIDDTLRELELAGQPALQTLTDLTDPARTDLPPLPPQLSAKLNDLALLAAEYSRLLGQSRSDSFSRTAAATRAIAELPDIHQWHVFVDGFLDFTGPQRALFAAIALRCPVHITLLIPPTSPVIDHPHHNHTSDHSPLSITGRTERAYTRIHRSMLTAGVQVLPHRRLASPPSAPAHAFLADHASTSGPAIFTQTATDTRHESTTTAALVASLLHQGTSAQDILLLTRSLDDYRAHLTEAFQQFQIPTFLDARRPATGHPLFAAMLILLDIARSGLTTDLIVSLLQTGITTVPTSTAAAIYRHATTQGLKDTAWYDDAYWTDTTALQGSAALEHSGDQDHTPDHTAWQRAHFSELAKARNTIHPPLAAWVSITRTPDLTYSQLAAALTTCLTALGAITTVESWINAAPASEDAEVHRETLKATTELLDEIATTLADEPAAGPEALATFTALLTAAGQEFEVAVTPASVHQIQIGQIDRTRTTRAPVVILLGLAAGSFPLSPSTQVILGDADRSRLTTLGVELSDDSLQQLLQEKLLAYIAVTRATKTLILLRPTLNTRGQPLEPSPYFETLAPLATAWPHPLPTSATAATLTTTQWLREVSVSDATSSLGSAQQNSGGGGRPLGRPEGGTAAQRGADPTGTSFSLISSPALTTYNSIRHSPLLATAVHWLITPPVQSIDPSLTRALLPDPVELSATHIEQFAECPYRAFAGRLLNIRSSADLRTSAPRRSELQRPAAITIGKRKPVALPQLTPTFSAARELRRRDTSQLITASLTDKPDRGDLTPAEVGLLQDRATDAATWVTAAIDRIRSVQPNRTYAPFNHPYTTVEIKTASGTTTIRMRAHTDVAELIADASGTQYLLVARYASYSGSVSEDGLAHGLFVRLLLDLVATYDHILRSNPGSPIVPAAALHLPIDILYERADAPPDPADDEDFLPKSLRPTGLLSTAAVETLDPFIRSQRSVFGISVNKDGSLSKRGSFLIHPEELTKLMTTTREVCLKLATALLAGQIQVHPYRIGTQTPCPNCHLRPVCRFDPATHPYNYLDTTTK